MYLINLHPLINYCIYHVACIYNFITCATTQVVPYILGTFVLSNVFFAGCLFGTKSKTKPPPKELDKLTELEKRAENLANHAQRHAKNIIILEEKYGITAKQ
ncbi:hypothetical protein HEP_00250400 [Hepatocystis sp. ex Piliocolobus tephrosceles]|nr:hypothetical protein HEP_00250400 [Hepatocystis sp. ex Piliocolobus tephrosceles]